MKKIINHLPFFVLFFLPLLFYHGVDASGWRSSSDVHASLEFASSLIAITAGIMVLLHFFTTGRWFFLIISIGFVLIGTEEFIHAIFSFNRIWSEIPPTFKLAISTTWLTGHFILLTSFFIALIFGERKIVSAKRELKAVIYNIIGLLCAIAVALLIFNSSFLPNFVQLGSITKKFIELSLALFYFIAFLFYSNIYVKQQSRSPLLWSIIAFIIFRVLAHIFVFDAKDFYDSHWDTAHLIVFLSYLFPVFGIWGETFKSHKSAQAQLIELEKEMAERKQAEEALRQSESRLRETLNNLDALVYIADMQTYEILFVNEYGKKIWGDLTGKTCWQSLQSGQKGPCSFCTNDRLLHPDGTPTGVYKWEIQNTVTRQWFECRDSAIYWPGGRTVRMEIATDITERKLMEQALRESENNLHEAQKLAHIGIWGWKADTDTVTWTEELYRIAGRDPMLPAPTYAEHLTLYAPESWEVLKTAVERAMKTGESYQLELKLIRPDNSTRYVNAFGGAKYDTHGQVHGLYGSVQDITERVQAEDALRESEALLREAQAAAHIGHWELDPSIMRPRWSEEIFYIFGLDPEKGEPSFAMHQEITHPDDWDILNNAVTTSIAEGISFDIEFRVHRPDKTIRWLHAIGYPKRDSEGRMESVFGTAQDITERKRAEEEVRKSNKYIQSILDNMPIGFGVNTIDDGVVKYLNNNFTKIYGWPKEVFTDVNKFFENVYPGVEGKELKARVISDMSSGDPGRMFWDDLEITTSTGEHRYISAMNMPILEQNLMISTVWDTTRLHKSQEALRESEGRYKRITEGLTDYQYTVRVEGGRAVATRQGPACATVTGYTAEEFEADPFLWFQMVAPEDREQVQERVQKILAGNEIAPIEHRIVRKDGEIRWVRDTMILNRDAAGKLLSYDGVIKDITERKRAEEELCDSKEFVENLITSMQDGLSVLDSDGVQIDVNAAFCQMAGYSREELIGFGPPHPYWPPESLEEIERGFQKTLRGEFSEVDLTFMRKNGERFPVIVSPSWVKDKQGNVVSYFAMVKDITERKRVEEALGTEKEKFKTLSEEAPFGMVTIDPDGTFRYINSKAKELFGYDLNDVPDGKTWFRKAYPDPTYRHHVIGTWIKDLEKYKRGEKRPEVFTVTCKDGTEKIINFFPVQLTTGENLVVCEDITERKRVEEEKQSLEERLNRAEKMEALGLLAGGVAHDLNNVLGIVIGYAELLLNDINESNPMRDDLLEIMDGGQKAAAIVLDLLTLARRGVSGRKVLNLNKLILDFQKSPELEKLFSYHPSVRIQTDLEPDLLNISAASVHLEKTLFNLVSNASEAMPKGGNLTIKTTNQYLDKPIQGYDNIRAGDYVVLSVSDEGEGISATDLKRIFEPFYTKKIMGRSGTGLGLSVVWGTVKDHQGYINVESEEGKGTIFTLYFSVTREDITAETSSVSMSEYMGKGESILVVDDVQGQRDLAAAMLKKLNYKVASVSSGEDAVGYLREHKVDLLVLDMIMEPGMDGLDTYKSVLEIHPKQKAIIVSGFSESDRVNAAYELGAGSYVKKPYVIEKLGMAVKNELARK